MDPMIPPQVGMRLWTKRKEAIEKREKAQIKKKEKKREGTMLLSFFHTCASKQHHDLYDRESPMCHFHILVGIFHYRTWLVYSNDGLPQNSHHTNLLWHFHSHSEIYFHATYHRSVYYNTLHHCHIASHDHVVDIVFVARPPFIIHTCHSCFIAYPGTPPEAFIQSHILF